MDQELKVSLGYRAELGAAQVVGDSSSETNRHQRKINSDSLCLSWLHLLTADTHLRPSGVIWGHWMCNGPLGCGDCSSSLWGSAPLITQA